MKIAAKLSVGIALSSRKSYVRRTCEWLTHNARGCSVWRRVFGSVSGKRREVHARNCANEDQHHQALRFRTVIAIADDCASDDETRVRRQALQGPKEP